MVAWLAMRCARRACRVVVGVLGVVLVVGACGDWRASRTPYVVVCVEKPYDASLGGVPDTLGRKTWEQRRAEINAAFASQGAAADPTAVFFWNARRDMVDRMRDKLRRRADWHQQRLGKEHSFLVYIPTPEPAFLVKPELDDTRMVSADYVVRYVQKGDEACFFKHNGYKYPLNLER